MKISKFAQFGIAMSLLTSLVSADEVTFAGSTSGAFNGGASSTLAGLSYFGSTFGPTTSAGGFVGLGGNGVALPNSNVNNLGAVSLSGAAWGYAGNWFTLQTTFTIPGGINEPNPAIHTATLIGNVASNSSGGITFDFNNAPSLFTFTSGSYTGSFAFSVNDVAIFPGQTASITGQITAASQSLREPQVPVPGVPDSGSTAALLGSALFGLAVMRRRERGA